MTAWNRYICLYLSVEPVNQELYCDTATCELPHYFYYDQVLY